MRAITLLLALSLSFVAFADQGGVHVIPFGPTTVTPVDVHIPLICGVSGHSITRVGDVFKITLLDPACVITIPIPYIYSARLPGLLAAGQYRVEVFLGNNTDSVFGTTSFVVREAGQKPFEIHPFAVPTTGADLRLRMTGVSCGATCDNVRIDVGGVRAKNVVQSGFNTIWFDAPPHPEGLVDVSVLIGDAVALSRGALYYFDHAERSVFERILFPVLFTTDGAAGSRWVSEATISNPRPWFVENANTLQRGILCITYPCGERLYPGSLERHSQGFPRGATLLVPRPEAPDLAFALRIRDVSRQAEGLGTQVPVVREKDFKHGEDIALLDVPLDPRYRVKLRVYQIEPVVMDSRFAQVTTRNPTTGATTGTVASFTLTPVENGLHYAELDLPSGAANERVNVYINMPLDATAWAFATVTNNATQQVTIVTPNGSGEQPCTNCTVP
jgi:hypothetical protein